MLTISKPLSAGQARRYHAEEFQNARENYYTKGDQIRGVWYGQLAAQWSLVGEVGEDQFQRLAEVSIRSPASSSSVIKRPARPEMLAARP
jgi:hypothetical protein